MEIVSEFGFRLDGRRPHELRRIRCRLGIYAQADGSAYLEQGYTKVLCAVYGPHEVRKNRSKILHDRAIINCQYSMATFSTGERKMRPRGDRKSQEFTQLLQKTFEASVLTSNYPRSQLDIYCEILQSDGGNLAACINAATLALIDAGVPMKDYVCACTCSCMNDSPIVDINYVEESQGFGPELVIACLPRSEQIVLCELNGKLHAEQLEKLMDAAAKSCNDVRAVLDQAVRNHVATVASGLGWE